jgi:hypothetical protein
VQIKKRQLYSKIPPPNVARPSLQHDGVLAVTLSVETA